MGGGGLAVGDQGAVGRPQGKEENGIPLAWCRGGGRCTMGGPTCQRLAKKKRHRGGLGVYTGMFTGGGAVINTTGRRVVQDAKEGQG